MRSGKKRKLSPLYVVPYEILKRDGSVAFELRFPNEFAIIHSALHLSMLNKCIGGTVYILPLEGLRVKEDLSYEEVPIDILYRQVKKLRNKDVS